MRCGLEVHTAMSDRESSHIIHADGALEGRYLGSRVDVWLEKLFRHLVCFRQINGSEILVLQIIIVVVQVRAGAVAKKVVKVLKAGRVRGSRVGTLTACVGCIDGGAPAFARRGCISQNRHCCGTSFAACWHVLREGAGCAVGAKVVCCE